MRERWDDLSPYSVRWPGVVFVALFILAMIVAGWGER